ncbi:MAG: SIMPL domain-containing protein [Roseburia sp.]|nr:SIMPL domain-containing protein [Roseburia sp.]
MGKIEIKGYATRRVHCDAMELVITFTADATSSKAASKQVMEQCELCLEKLEELGINISKIQISDDSTQKSRYREERSHSANRSITLKSKFDMVLVNTIRELLNTLKVETDVTINFTFSNSKQLKTELLKEALLDSRQKATDIAKALDQKVVCLISANKKSSYDIDYDEEDDELVCEQADLVLRKTIKIPQFLKRSSLLSSPEITESEEITAVWEIE